MRSRIRIVGVLAAVLCACGGDDSDDHGGHAGSGGSAGGGECPALQACGGDPVGDWTVDSVCVSDPSALFQAAINQPACKSALTSTSDVDASGSYKLGMDMKAVSTIVVSGTGQFSFDDACVKALGVAQSAAGECSKIQTELGKTSGVKSATCMAKAPKCDCTVSLETSLAGSGMYTVANNKITVNGMMQPFCVQTNKLSIETSANGVSSTFKMSKP